MKYRYEIINHIIEKRGYKSYLEIGVKDGVCFDRIICRGKWGMDINPLFVNPNVKKMSSDDYFAMTRGVEFDIIFIDGDHHEEQVDRDLWNALRCLAPNGTIVMHDCDPKDAKYATHEREADQIIWSGTAYKSFLSMRRSNPGLTMFVVDIDWGCGVIQRGEQTLLDIPEHPTWDEFDANKTSWLNLINVEEFMRRIK